VTLSWKPVAGAAHYTLSIQRNGRPYLQDSSVDLSWFTLSQAEPGGYTVYITAHNCAGISETTVYNFSVIESMPNVPIWVTDSTLEAAQDNARVNQARYEILLNNCGRNQTLLDAPILN